MRPEDPKKTLADNLDTVEFIMTYAFRAAYDTVNTITKNTLERVDIVSHPLFPVYAELFIKVLKG